MTKKKKSLSDHVYFKCAHTAQEESVIKVWLIFFFKLRPHEERFYLHRIMELCG